MKCEIRVYCPSMTYNTDWPFPKSVNKLKRKGKWKRIHKLWKFVIKQNAWALVLENPALIVKHGLE